MIVGVLVELLIATAMCWSLYRKKTGFARQVHPFDIDAIEADVHTQN